MTRRSFQKSLRASIYGAVCLLTVVAWSLKDQSQQRAYYVLWVVLLLLEVGAGVWLFLSHSNDEDEG